MKTSPRRLLDELLTEEKTTSVLSSEESAGPANDSIIDRSSEAPVYSHNYSA